MENLADLAYQEKISDFKERIDQMLVQKIRDNEEFQNYYKEVEELKKTTQAIMKLMGEE